MKEELEEELALNSAKAAGGTSLAWLNGAPLNEGDMNPFSYVLSLHFCLLEQQY